MGPYTADAVALLAYLVDSLPRRADRIFAAGEAGETVIQAPSSVVAEVLYSVSRDKTVRGVELQGSPEETRAALVGTGPVTLAPVGERELEAFAPLVSECSIHDALVVSSHRARETEAVITTDDVIQDLGVPTVWE